MSKSVQKISTLVTRTIYVLVALPIFFSHAIADAVDDFLRLKMSENRIPGLQVAVIKNNKIIKVTSYGLANVQDEVKVDNTTVFNLASITKAFTSVAVMQLVEKGDLALSLPISTYLSDLPKSWQKVTLQQVLSHTSGLPDIMNRNFQLIDSEGEQQSWLKVKQQDLYFEPDTAFHYNQTNYLIVGKIIEQITGKSYAQLIEEFQLNNKNLVLTRTAGFSHFLSVNSHQARDYRLNNQNELTNVLTYFPAIIRAGAGMSSSATELAYWTLQLQNGAFFKSSDSLNTLWKATALINDHWAKENPSMHPYALGWYVVESPKGLKIVTAGGGQSAIAVYPDLNISIVILSNLAGAKPENLMDEVVEFYIEDFGLSDDVKLLKRELQQQNYRNPLSIAQKLQKEHRFTFDANDLNHFGNLLVKHLKYDSAQKVFSLNNQLHSKTILNSDLLDNYIGTYQLADFSIVVTREANALFITATGESRLPVFAETQTTFTLKAVDAKVTFVNKQTDGVSGLMLNINGNKLFGKKI